MSRHLDYEDFALKIVPDGRGGWQTRLLRSPYGAGDTPFAPPYSAEVLAEMMPLLEKAVVGSASSARERAPTRNLHSSKQIDPPEIEIEEVGQALFDALLSGPVRESYFASRGRVESQSGMGLRLRIVLDPTQPEAAQLLNLPWELLYRGNTRDFLARHHRTPVVRCLEVPQLRSSPSLGSELRVLVAIADPRDAMRLDVRAERQRLEKAWETHPSVELEFLENPTLEEIRKALRDRPYEVFHFIGHGDFNGQSGEGALLFESTEGRPHPVPGRVLAETLRGGEGLRLVFLNACDTARLPRWRGQDPYTGAASALVIHGVPAVVAMQFPISDRAALVFSEAFYSALAAGDPADAAVTEGRVALYQAAPDSWEWVTPVLFLSIPDGELFAASSSSASEKVRDDKGDAAATNHSSEGGSPKYNTEIKDSKGVVIGDHVKIGDLEL